MTEWGVVGVIAALLGLVGSVWAIADRIGKPVKELTEKVIVLTVELAGLTKQLEKLDSANEKEHIAMWDRVDDHETRITVLEQK